MSAAARAMPRREGGRVDGLVARLLTMAVRAYQHIPRMGPPRCRFAPTCSQYALEALEAHGALRGTWLALARLVQCHPFHAGGIDRVPPPSARQRQGATS